MYTNNKEIFVGEITNIHGGATEKFLPSGYFSEIQFSKLLFYSRNLVNDNYLGVVVLFWNDYKKTIKCLNSLFNQNKVSPLIVLVDNNSEQYYFEKITIWLKKKKIKILKNKNDFYKNKINKNKKKIYYIKNKENFGCGLGHNPGYKFLLLNKFKYIARMDNDIVLLENMHNLTKDWKLTIQSLVLVQKYYMVIKKYVWYRGTTVEII